MLSPSLGRHCICVAASDAMGAHLLSVVYSVCFHCLKVCSLDFGPRSSYGVRLVILGARCSLSNEMLVLDGL